jgi:hypothetical protein
MKAGCHLANKNYDFWRYNSPNAISNKLLRCSEVTSRGFKIQIFLGCAGAGTGGRVVASNLHNLIAIELARVAFGDFSSTDCTTLKWPGHHSPLARAGHIPKILLQICNSTWLKKMTCDQTATNLIFRQGNRCLDHGNPWPCSCWGHSGLINKSIFKNYLHLSFQTITGAMSTLNPPVLLENPANQHRVDYIQDVASSADFDYPEVGHIRYYPEPHFWWLNMSSQPAEGLIKYW